MKNIKLRIGHTLTLLFCLFYAQSIAQLNKPPTAPIREITDEYYGQKIVDPYRWMEDLKSKETSEWMKAQAHHTRSYLDRLPLRQELVKRLTELNTTGVRVFGIQRRGERYFYYKLAPGDNDRKLYVRDGLDGTERLLVDPEKLSQGGKRYSISSYNPSPDGRLVSFLISAGGSEFGEIRVLQVETGKETGDRIKETRWAAGQWMPDGRSFLYRKFQRLPPDAPQTERLQKIRVYRHMLGTKPETDKAIFGYAVNPNIKLETTQIPFVSIPRHSKYAMALVNSGVSPNSDIYIAPVDSLDKVPIPWQKIADLEDEISGAFIRDGDIYMLTYKKTPRYKVIRKKLNDPDFSRAETVFPESDAVVRNFALAKDALYVETLDAGVPRIWRVDYNGRKAEPLNLPHEGAAEITLGESDRDGILYQIYWWTKSPAVFSYDAKTGKSADTRLVPPIPVDMTSVEAYFVKVRSHDGTMVPMAIIHKKDLKRDGTNPTLLNGYGAYGINSVEPGFGPPLLAWLERGGVFAVAGVRGGGEYGEEWHRAGFQKTKPNTWKDFISAAEYLIKEKYTSPQHLAGQGVSAGGILIGNSIAERPDLFAAAQIAVGLNNTLRAETTANGVPNIPEFGSVKTEDGFKALLAMDAYHKVKDGVKYPAIILTHGINDPRVEPWMSAKMAARLQAASTSNRPVLLRIDYDAGHGIGSSRSQAIELLADVFAFLFEQLRNDTKK